MGRRWRAIKENMTYLKKFSLNKKTALITGSGGMLGFEHACALLEAGANVILTDNKKEQLKKTTHKIKKYFNQDKLISIVMDVTKENSIKNCLKKIKKKNINIDILINNAAINPKMKKMKKKINLRLENLSLSDWNQDVAVSLTGTFLCSKIFGEEMAKNKSGVILNILSDLSLISPDQRIYKKKNLKPNQQTVKPISYSVAKTGLIGLTKYVATYWARNGVRCNAISPGSVFENQNKNLIKNLNNLIPMGRMANRDEYRSAIQFLCSDASAYMNGHNLVMDGGRSIW